MDLSLSNVINISVAQAPLGLSAYNTSNVALFSDEANTLVDDYKIYKEPTEVGKDFGTSSDTYKMALALFSQAPNILANNGYLVIIPLEASETLDVAIARTAAQVHYNAIICNYIELEDEVLDTAAVVQALNKIYLTVQRASASVEPTTGLLDKIRAGGFNKTRGLYYGVATDTEAVRMKAAYTGRAFSTVFSGSNTTSTMHLKDLATILPDPTMTQTLFEKAKAAGADIYASFQGLPKVYSMGANMYFDQVYNLNWFVGALQIASFNFLAQTSTKIPQTENGMDGFKGAQRAVCVQAVTNQYSAPGEWNSPITFGDQAEFLENIRQFGFYVFAEPIASQSQVDREARIAPLVQIALKEAGAIQSGTIIINVNP